VGIFRALGVHQNYRFRGEVLPQGALILRQGEEITAPHLGLLAAQGFEEILVFARPRVGILSTGSELMSGGAPLAPGKIYDSNRYFLAARAADLGAEAVWAAPTADDPQLIAEALAALGERCDLVISTGGVSLGDHDYLPQAGAYLGARPLFRRVAMKPGGWVTALYWDGKIMLCLSGNPLAAAMSFDLLAGPVIRRLAGAEPALPSELWGVLQDPFPKASPVGRFVYARRDGAAVFLPRARAASLTSLLGCNCILTLPQGTGSLVPGAEVALIPL
jgi:molybdopterin molybdotransferase